MFWGTKGTRLAVLLAVFLSVGSFILLVLQTAVSSAAFLADSWINQNEISWVINEIHADPAGDMTGDANQDGASNAAQDEFVELVNDSGAAIDIEGWTLSDGFMVRHTFPAGSVVPNQCAIIVFGGGTPVGEFGGAVVQTASSGGLNLDNTGDLITLSDGHGSSVSVRYGLEGNQDQSLTRFPDVTGDFTGHLALAAQPFSPGSKIDGTAFVGCDPTDDPPVVVDMSPVNGASSVGIDSQIVITFSEPVFLSAPWNEIKCAQSGLHKALVSAQGAVVQLIPNRAFDYGERCQVALYAAGIVDLDEEPQPMPGDVQWAFTTTVGEPDNVPAIIDAYPEIGASQVSISTTLTITFSEPISLSATAVWLACTHSGDISLTVSGGPAVFSFRPEHYLAYGERCALSVDGDGVHDLDLDDPPDQMTGDWQNTFWVESVDFLMINELDAVTPGIDQEEFVELYDGGRGKTHLDGLSVVLYSGHDDAVYASFDLSGHQTDAQGYFLLASESVPGADLIMDDSRLQNGADAAALYREPATVFPVGTTITTVNLLDALVYDTGQEPDVALLDLLMPGEEQVNENGRDLKAFHSLQRCPNGGGGARRTSSYLPERPTPKQPNNCLTDEPPQIVQTHPHDSARDVAIDSTIRITFSEAITVTESWAAINCTNSGHHEAESDMSGEVVTLKPKAPFVYGETCQVEVLGSQIHDLDADDPPDQLYRDFLWSFSIVPADFMLINELDADTPGPDSAEFIELYDGGHGHTLLTGLVLVLFNGRDDLSYAALDLDGYETDEHGYFLLGNSAVASVDYVIPEGFLQNGPDAVTLYKADGEEFPNGSALDIGNLVDAIVYGAGDDADDGLLRLLLAEERQVDEDGRGNGDGDSLQRCPNGAAGQRRTVSFLANTPTPGAANRCDFDQAPYVTDTIPLDGQEALPLGASVVINFSELVDLEVGWQRLECEKTGLTAVNILRQDKQVKLDPLTPLPADDRCTLTIIAEKVHDLDTDDPPDVMAQNKVVQFRTTMPDAAPAVVTVFPADGAIDVNLSVNLAIQFSEEVLLADGAVTLQCSRSGMHELSWSREAADYVLHSLQPLNMGERCTATVHAGMVIDLDADDPPDQMAEDFTWFFDTIPVPVAEHVLINEVDADTAGIDTAEFIELFDNGDGQTRLDGLVVVLFNGSNSLSYAAIDLDQYVTNDAGYFLLGNSAVRGVDHILADGMLQNGPDAIALYRGDALDFPNGSPVTTDNLLDAIVYDTGTMSPEELMPLLLPGEAIIDEDSRGAKDVHSSQRCPNGAGEQRRTATYVQNLPTPKAASFCDIDDAPGVIMTFPEDGARDVERDTVLTLDFSEAVTLADGAISLWCNKSGAYDLNVSGGPDKYRLQPSRTFAGNDICRVRVVGSNVSDLDNNDPPDNMIQDVSWTFETAGVTVARHMIINEIDADTPGIDRAEFIELYDGGVGFTELEGLAVVLYSGDSDLAYRTIDLDGALTKADGYFVIGNSAVRGVDLTIPNGTLQNGPDAVALYVGDIGDGIGKNGPVLDGLLDAIVYGTNYATDSGLSVLLLDGEPQLNEGTWRDADIDSNQRCPNGARNWRRTTDFIQNQPTPGQSNNCIVDTPPAIAAVMPDAGAIDVVVDSRLTIVFDEPVVVDEEWIELACESLTSPVPLMVSGGPTGYVVQTAGMPPYERCTVTVLAAKVHDLDGYPDRIKEDYDWSFSTGKALFGACGEEATLIHDIQGQGDESPLLGTRGVIVEGVVSGVFQESGSLGGFFLQEEATDFDDDSQTSEGIFVMDDGAMTGLYLGRRVRLQGDVSEIEEMTGLINIRNWENCATETAVLPQTISLPLEKEYPWEALEGMAVRIPQPITVIGTDRWGSHGIIELAEERLYYPTQITSPGPGARSLSEQNRHNHVLLDDGSRILWPQPLPPFLGADNTIRVGDTVENLMGVVSHDDDEYRIQPVLRPQFKRENPRLALAPPAPGQVRIAHLNTAGLYDGNGKDGFVADRGPQSLFEVGRQREKLVSAIVALNSGIIALTEVENDGFAEGSSVRGLLDALNDRVPEGQGYKIVIPDDDGPQIFHDTVVLLYREDVVIPIDKALALSEPPFDEKVRRAVGQQFVSKASGHAFAVFVTQFPERGNCPKDGPNRDQKDGQACWNELRTQAAEVLALRANQLFAAGGDAVLIGDFNSYAREDPILTMQQAGLRQVLLPDGGSGYTTVIDGESGTLNYAFVTPGLVDRVAFGQQWHINADEPLALDYREVNQAALYAADEYRSAVTDPLLVDIAPAPLTAGFNLIGPVIVGKAVYFNNTTRGPRPLTFIWDFGDGTLPTAFENPEHIFTQVGVFRVTLTAKTSWGETAAFSAPVAVQPVLLYIPLVKRP